MHKAILTCAFASTAEAMEAGEDLFPRVAGFWEGVQYPPMKDQLNGRISIDTRNLRVDADGLRVYIEVQTLGDETIVARQFFQWWNKSAPSKGLKLDGCVATLR